MALRERLRQRRLEQAALHGDPNASWSAVHAIGDKARLKNIARNASDTEVRKEAAKRLETE